MIDVVKDMVDCPSEEDPTLYVSEKTGRGPLNVNWLEEYSRVSLVNTFVLKRDFLLVI